MRLVAATVLFALVLLVPSQGMADGPTAPDVTDPQDDLNADPATPSVTRELDPPTVVDALPASDAGVAATEVVTPMPFPTEPPQRLPPGPPSRLP